MTSECVELTLAEAIATAAALCGAGAERVRMLGITGAPGAGKTTVARAIADAVPGSVLVGMDGFHLAHALLVQRGLRDRKGAPHTFDVHGFTALLTRIRDQRPGDPEVYAPLFDRAIEDSIGSAVEVAAEAPLVIVEGNYLLHDRDGWEHVAGALDRVWFLDPPETLRHERLIARHEQFGRSPEQARQWALGTDELNAALVRDGRERADMILSVTGDTRQEGEAA